MLDKVKKRFNTGQTARYINTRHLLKDPKARYASKGPNAALQPIQNHVRALNHSIDASRRVQSREKSLEGKGKQVHTTLERTIKDHVKHLASESMDGSVAFFHSRNPRTKLNNKINIQDQEFIESIETRLSSRQNCMTNRDQG